MIQAGIGERMMNGDETRRRILALRDGAAGDERERWSAAISEFLLDFAPFCRAGTVMAFASFRSEVDTGPIVEAALARGQRVVLPRSLVGERRMALYEIDDPASQLSPGYCGIPEPLPKRCRAVDPAAVEVVLLPGSVFSRKGQRLGYGGGFYDRFLANEAPEALRIGLCFGLQIVEQIPQEPHDQAMDYLVCEKGVIDCRTGSV